MNIILKSFDGYPNHITIERAFRNIKLGTCISLLWGGKREAPTLNADEHLLFDSKMFKNGEYPNTDWTTITPLDEELIESMRHCEAVFMTMITRHSPDDIPYGDRKRQYFDHLRFWNHILETKKIDFFLLNHPPHQSYDLVIYDLCKLKGVPTMILDRCHFIRCAVCVETWENSATQIRDRFVELQKEYRDPALPVPLSAKFERFYQGQIKDEDPWYMYARPKHLLEKNFVRKWARIAMNMAVRRPKKFLSYLVSLRFWQRKLREHTTIGFYDRNIGNPDLSKPYIYVPLHLQPEATTCPLGGAFVDQERMIQMLAWHLPKGVSLYVKEHPHQIELMRSRAFYQSLLDLPSVTFVPRFTSTQELIRNSAAIATVTGTAGLEGLFREKPCLLFGHCYYQYASGVHMIRSNDDCKRAVERIFVHKERPALRDARLYLKAFDELSTTYEYCPLEPGETTPAEEQALTLGEHMERRVREAMKSV